MKVLNDLSNANLNRQIESSKSRISKLSNQLVDLDIKKKEVELALEKEKIKLKQLDDKKEQKSK